MTRFSCHRSWHFRLRLRLASTWIELWHDRIIIQIVWMLFVANRRPYRGCAAEWGGEGTIFGDLQRSPLSRDRKRSWWTLTAFAASPGHASWLAKSPQHSSARWLFYVFYVLCVFFFFFLFIIVVILLLFVFNTFGFLNTLGSFCFDSFKLRHTECSLPKGDRCCWHCQIVVNQAQK